MAKKTNGDKQDARRVEAERRCRLNQEEIRMAKEMGLNPRSLIKSIPSKTEPWKEPVKGWIHEIYHKREEKAAKRKARRSTCCSASEQQAGEEAADCTGRQGEPRQGEPWHDKLLPGSAEPGDEDLVEIAGDTWPQKRDTRPNEQEIEEEDQTMLRLQRNFRLAADVVADAFAQLPEVERVVLFGSVAVPLEREVPRFRKFRRHEVAIWHECKDVDLAVWLSDLTHLRNLQKARSRALNELYRKQNVGVAHHQVEVFIMEPGTNLYLGRLCSFTRCPKDKLDCLVPGCGDTTFLKQLKGFIFSKDALAAEKTITLFDRQHPLRGG